MQVRVERAHLRRRSDGYRQLAESTTLAADWRGQVICSGFLSVACIIHCKTPCLEQDAFDSVTVRDGGLLNDLCSDESILALLFCVFLSSLVLPILFIFT